MSVRSGMADCAVALDALCLRIAPPESLDVTKLAHAFVTLARPGAGCRSQPASLCAVMGATHTVGRPGPDTAAAAPPTHGQGVGGLRGPAGRSVSTDCQPLRRRRCNLGKRGKPRVTCI